MTGIEANGASTGAQTSDLTISGLDTTTTNTQYVYKTKPTITKVALSGMSDNTEAELYKFKIAADSKGDVGFAKATFKITTTTVSVTDLKLYEDGVDITETAITPTVAESDAATTYDIFNVLLETDANIGNEYVIIGANDDKTYTLKGNVSGWGTGDKITVEMLGDNAHGDVDNFTAVDGYASDNFIWSDLYLGWNTTTATGANEWTNGYKVLSTTTQQFTY